MRHLTRQEWIGGTDAHVGDCYVWAQIYYLDSATDYREFLPCDNPPLMPPYGELKMLENRAIFSRIKFRWILAARSALS